MMMKSKQSKNNTIKPKNDSKKQFATSANHGKAQHIRIIGGTFKRRQLMFAAIPHLRPTPDRVRETLFNWLMWEIQGAKVLDLCAGSGALSFEAVSRQAKHVVMIEPQPQQVDVLRQNIQLLKVENMEIRAMTAQQAIKQYISQKEKFDIVLIDPPYQLELWQELAQMVEPLLTENAYIYIEANRPLQELILPSTWQLLKQTKAGIVQAGLWQNSKEKQ